MKLTGRTILITGGSAGIGLAFALKFVEQLWKASKKLVPVAVGKIG
jgi:short-subunit dehydrogenase involved in D-alanine esterification of teichoic acids